MDIQKFFGYGSGVKKSISAHLWQVAYAKLHTVTASNNGDHPTTDIPSKLRACTAAQLLRSLCAVATMLSAIKFVLL